MKARKLERLIFCVRDSSSNEPEAEEQEPMSKQFFKVKTEMIKSTQNKFKVLKVQDITINIRLQLSQQQKKVLQIVNACVSHEMRNPINSIIAMNLQLRDQVDELSQILEIIASLSKNNELTNDKLMQLLSKCDAVNKEMKVHAEIQLSSTKLLNFYVADLLSLSQIEKNKFRKTIEKFDVKQAVEEVISIQRDKIEFNKITLKTEFLGFDNNYEIFTDKMRLQQVLLNYQSNAIKFTPKTGKILIKCVKHRYIGEHGQIDIKVTDNGVGIKEED